MVFKRYVKLLLTISHNYPILISNIYLARLFLQKKTQSGFTRRTSQALGCERIGDKASKVTNDEEEFDKSLECCHATLVPNEK